MAKVIRLDHIVEDDWLLAQFPPRNEPVRKQAGKPVIFRVTGDSAASEAEIAAFVVPQEKALVPLSVWLARGDTLLARAEDGTLGVWIESFESPEALAQSVDDLNRIPVIGIHFPRFADGRGFSYARLLRSRYGYRGELRALGDVQRDQLFYLRRCGFDVFAVRSDKNVEDAVQGLKDFSVTYQDAADTPRPLFRRIARANP